MSLISYKKEINILKKNLNLNSLIISRENILNLSGTESGYEIIQSFGKDIKNNVDIIEAIVILLQRPEELEKEDIDIYSLEIVKKGLLDKYKKYSNTELRNKIKDDIINNFIGEDNISEYFKNISTRKLKSVYHSVFNTKDEEIEYIKYTKDRIKLDKLASIILNKNLEFNDKLTPQQFENYTLELSGSVATVYTEKKDSTIIEKKSGISSIIKNSKSLEIDEEFLQLLNDNTYINKIEIDSSTDIDKLKDFLKEIKSMNLNTEESIYLKIRFLGKHNATGIYYSGLNIVGVDIRQEYSFAHEITHHIDFTTKIKDRKEILSTFNKYNKYNKNDSKIDYYSNHYEVIARAGELSYSLMQSNFSDIFNSYKNNIDYNGKKITKDNFLEVIINNSKKTRLANDLNYYSYVSPDIYFNLPERTPEEISEFYFYFQNIFNYKDKISVKRSDKQNYAESMERQRSSKRSRKRILKKGFSTYTYEDFLSVIEEYNNSNIDIMTKEEFYISALSSFNHKLKFKVMKLILDDDKLLDKEKLFQVYLNEIKAKAKYIIETLKSSSNNNDSKILNNITEEKVVNYMIVGNNSVILEIEELVNKIENNKIDKKIEYSKIEKYLNSCLLKNDDVLVIINILKNISNNDFNKTELVKLILNNTSFKYQNELNEFIEIFKNGFKQKELEDIFVVIELSKMKEINKIPTYLYNGIKKIINYSDNKETINKKIVSLLDEVPNNLSKQIFIKNNTYLIEEKDYKKYGILTFNNMKDFEDISLEELYFLYKENKIILSITDTENISKYKDNKLVEYLRFLRKLNNFNPEYIEKKGDINYNNGKLTIGNEEFLINKISYKGHEVIETSNNTFYEIKDEGYEKRISNDKVKKIIQKYSTQDKELITDTDLINSNFSSYQKVNYIYIDRINNKVIGITDLKEIKINKENGILKVENDNDNNIVYHNDKSKFDLLDENTIKLSYNFNDIGLDTRDIFGKNLQDIIKNSINTIEELSEILSILFKDFEKEEENLLRRDFNINKIINEKFGNKGNIELAKIFTKSVLENKSYVNYVKIDSLIENIGINNLNVQETIDFTKDIINNILLIGEKVAINAKNNLLDEYNNLEKPVDKIFIEENINYLYNKVKTNSIILASNYYKHIKDIINNKNEILVKHIWNNIEEEKNNTKNDKIPLNEILDYLNKNLDKYKYAEATLKKLIENTNSKKKVNISEFMKILETNQNTNLNNKLFNIGEKNIFDYADNIASSTRKSTIIMKPLDVNLYQQNTTQVEAKEQIEYLKKLNKSLGIDENNSYSIGQTNLGFVKLSNSISDIISNKSNKFIKEIKIKNKNNITNENNISNNN